ncbi:ABC transporter permease [Mesorhizobium sp. M0701]|uniref:ABC transporter permease n=1 Tax=Mesorhizobium sp. M0701 TaxID=2956989 RepID=UPI00333908F1
MAVAVMKLKALKFSQFWIVVVIFILMFLTFSVLLPGFLTELNLIALLQNVSILGILGLSMAIIVIGRGIDLSTVSMLAVPPGLVLQMVQDGHSVPMAFLAALGLVILFSLIVGWFVAYAEVPSLYTTLGAGIFLAGLGQSAFFTLDVVQWSPELDVIAWVGRGDLLGVPKPVFMFALAVIAIAIFLKKTKVGNFIYAIGDNPHAARTAGIPTRPTIVFQYVLAGLIAAFAGIVMAASISSMPTRIYNSTLIYDVILVVVLGGIGLSGGRGGVPNVILGTVFIGTLINGMTILNISYSAQNIIKGIVLLIALLVDTKINPRNEETAQQGDV